MTSFIAASVYRGPLREDRLDRGEVVPRERDVHGRDVLLEVRAPLRPRERHEERRLREHPGERELRGRDSLPLRELLDLRDEREILRNGVVLEARVRPAEVRGIEQGAAELDRAVNRGDRCRFAPLRGRAVEVAHAHAAKAKRGDVEGSELAVGQRHGPIPRRSRMHACVNGNVAPRVVDFTTFCCPSSTADTPTRYGYADRQ